MTTALTKLNSVQVTASENFADNLIERFVKFAGVSESSRMTYAKSLRQLFSYFKANSITRPTRENLVDWIDGMKKIGKSPSTIQLYLTAAKIFFRWLNQEGIFPNIADNLKSGLKPNHTHKKDALSVEQCAELIKNVKAVAPKTQKHNEEKELRDKAIEQTSAIFALNAEKFFCMCRVKVTPAPMKKFYWRSKRTRQFKCI